MIDEIRPCGDVQIREQLSRIFASGEFVTSERNRRFLEYIVEEDLAGRAARIKAYNIATSVFGRDSGFDPQMDPIVRIEARRLRRSLERYYLTAGRDDSLRISIPKGSYVPAYELVLTGEGDLASVASPQAAEDKGRRRTGCPSILVAQFEEQAEGTAFQNLTRGFVRQIIVGLARFNDLRVFGPETVGGCDIDLARLRDVIEVEFLLTGGATVSADRFAVEALLIDAQTGQNVWAASFDRTLTPAGILEIRDEVANQVARTLAQPFGVIFTNRVRETDGLPPEALTSYSCVMRFYQYWRSYRRELHEPVRRCLEQTVQNDPGYAEAFSCLSLVYCDAYRFGFGSGIPVAIDPRRKALALALRAVELAPMASQSHHALGLAYWFAGDIPAALESLRRGLALNPNDTQVMAELGLRCCEIGQWDEGVALLDEAFLRNPAQPGVYRVGLSLWHYVHGRYEEALREAQKVDATQVVYGHVLEAISAARLGLREQAEAALRSIRIIDPAYGDHVVEDLGKRNIRGDLIDAVIEGLRLAGLEGLETGRRGAPAPNVINNDLRTRR